MEGINIYITDDDEDDRMFLKEAMRNVTPSVNIVEAQDGLDLLAKLQQSMPSKSQFTMILIDMNMPRLNGLETVNLLKLNTEYQKIPVIMISTSEDNELKQDAYKMGVDSFITKPHTFTDYEALAKGLKSIYLAKFQERN